MSDEVQPGFVRVRLDLSYDGTEFSGWAKQAAGRRTVQGEIEDALRTVTRSGETTYELTVAGRTDAGVHARGRWRMSICPGSCGPSIRRSCSSGSRGDCPRMCGCGR
ncbi:hypothetical protein SAV31267_042240 [Streptomyces avermitilis]|uniref:tRNA pseudouridine synthase n=1 Tax=Streptomyces avermitilis TaxID=33903 RepID=A0A4D4MTS3_STRAX|nr:hypothetical protein SAV31267_042240 [Streptomyces avermitilis]